MLKKIITYITTLFFSFSIIVSPIIPSKKVYAAEGYTRYEAEAATLNNASTETLGGQTGGVTYSGSSFVAMHGKGESSSITWSNVKAPTAGSYILKFKYSNRTSSNKPISLTINGQTIKTFVAEQTTGESYPVWLDLTAQEVNLSEGDNIIKLASEGTEGPDIDCFDINTGSTEPDPDPDPDPDTDPDPDPNTDPQNNIDLGVGYTIYEAENGVANNTDMQSPVKSDTLTYSGDSFTIMKSKDDSSSITWSNVTVPITGNYIMTFKYSNNVEADKPVSITANGQKVSTFKSVKTGKETYPTWNYLTAVVILNEGDNTIKLASEGSDGPAIDCFGIKTYSTIYEGESAILTQASKAVGTTNGAGFTGTGYVSISAGKDATANILWNNVVVPGAGKYTIKLRYSLGNSARPAKVSINGGNAIDVKALGTGLFSNWTYDQLLSVDLTAGVNTIKLEPSIVGKPTALYDRIEIVSEKKLVLGEQTFNTTYFETAEIDSSTTLIDGKTFKPTSEATYKIVEESGNKWAKVITPATKQGVVGFPFHSSLNVPVSMNSYTFESSFVFKDDNANYLLNMNNSSPLIDNQMVVFSMDGGIYARSNNTANGALAERAKWTVNTNYKVKLVFHVDTKSYDMYLNGEKIVNSEPMKADTYLGGFKGLFMEVKSGARLETAMLVDDVVLSGSNAVGTAPVVNPNPGQVYVEPPYIGEPVTYYVSPTSIGNDSSNDGKSAEKPFKTIQKAASLTNAGDTVLIMPGEYYATENSNKWLNITRSGAYDKKTSTAHYVTYKAYDSNNKPKIMLPDNIGGVWNMVFVEANYIIIDGLEIEGNKAATLAMGEENYEAVAAGGVDWVKFAKTNTNGISVHGNRIVVRNCDVHDMAAAGIGGGGDYITVENNISHSNCWYTFYATSGISFMANVDSDNNTTDYKIIVRNNTVYDNETMVKWVTTKNYSDGNGIIFDVDDAYKGKKLVENNIVYENGGSGIHTYKSHNVDIVNNTIYNNSRSPHMSYQQLFANASDNNNFLNNIVYGREGKQNISNGGFNNVFANNIFFGGNTIAGHAGINYKIADPKFVSLEEGKYDFHLQENSPAIDNGTKTRAPQTDIIGDSRPQGAKYDIGAYESSYTSANPIVNDEVVISPPKPDVNEVATASKGTPVLDGEIDPSWSTTMMFETLKLNNSNLPAATAKIRTLWDENNLYVLAEVTDPSLSSVSANAYEHDSVEFFMDENNEKTTTYQPDDGQYRVNFEGLITGAIKGKNTELNKCNAVSKIIDGGYIIEAKLPLATVTGEVGRILGFDVQVNDDNNSDGVKDNLAQWSSQKTDSFITTQRLGNLTLVEAPAKSTDATLSDLLVGDVTVEGFTADTINYNVELPIGTTTVPQVTATTTTNSATVVITPATSLTEVTTVLVTAEDGSTKKIYTIKFSIKTVVPIVVYKEELTTSIKNATRLMDSKTVGKAVGNVPQASKTAYRNEIKSATKVKENVIANQEEVDRSIVTLAAATTNFNKAVIKAIRTLHWFYYISHLINHYLVSLLQWFTW